jgi:hypothetical protein
MPLPSIRAFVACKNGENLPTISFKDGSKSVLRYFRVEFYICVTNQHDALFTSVYSRIAAPLYVSGQFLAHHQEGVSVYVAKCICFSSKSSKQITFATHTFTAS